MQRPAGARAVPLGRLALLALLLPGLAAGEARRCEGDEAHTSAISAYVYDGDTLRLSDGRKVRLLGIDAPEVGRDGAPPQPYAAAALELVESLIPRGASVGLRFDVEKQDAYGRTLAHVLLADGTNVQVALLGRGLATTLVVPPNEVNLRCYAAAESLAMARAEGVWSLADYQPVAASDLPLGVRGYRRVIGTVRRVGEGGGAVWLGLAPHVSIRIPLADLPNFAPLDPRGLLGSRVRARGWLAPRRGELRMTIRHPAGLELLP